jgi:Tol biopolymer transport system component
MDGMNDMRRFIRVTAGIWLLIVIVLVAVLVVGHVLGRDSGIIAFQSGRIGDTAIYLYDVPTGMIHNLTRSPARSQPIQQRLYDGDPAEYPTWQQHMVSQGSDVSPTWSPDGTRLAFVSYRDANSEIYLLDLRTGSRRNLTNHPAPDTSPVWSPDGNHLVFESSRDGYWGIWLADLERGTIRALTDHAYASQSPTWSPDSRRIVFQSRRDRHARWDLYMINLETGEIRNLTNSTSDDVNPVWTAIR